MKNPAQPRRAPVLLENRQAIAPRFAAVDDDGKLCLGGKRELFSKYALLDVAWRKIVVVIEANLAPGNHAVMLRQAREFIVMRLRDFFRFVRVNADGGVDPVVRVGERQRRVELLRAGACADGEECGDSCRARPLEHFRAVAIKLRQIYVRVRVDQFHSAILAARRLPPLRETPPAPAGPPAPPRRPQSSNSIRRRAACAAGGSPPRSLCGRPGLRACNAARYPRQSAAPLRRYPRSL